MFQLQMSFYTHAANLHREADWWMPMEKFETGSNDIQCFKNGHTRLT